MIVNKVGENVLSSWFLIPPQIWCDSKLNITKKCLLGRINALQDETGKCYAGNEYLGKQLNLTSNRVSHIIKELITDGYLCREVIFNDKKEIIKRYLLLKITIPLVENNNTPIVENNKDRVDVLEENIEVISIADKSAEPDINHLISLFEPVNPSYKTLFANKTQRSALERLVKEHGIEKIDRVISSLIHVVTRPFAPKITTPLQLEQKLGELKIFMSQNVSSKKRGGVAYVG